MISSGDPPFTVLDLLCMLHLLVLIIICTSNHTKPYKICHDKKHIVTTSHENNFIPLSYRGATYMHTDIQTNRKTKTNNNTLVLFFKIQTTCKILFRIYKPFLNFWLCFSCLVSVPDVLFKIIVCCMSLVCFDHSLQLTNQMPFEMIRNTP